MPQGWTPVSAGGWAPVRQNTSPAQPSLMDRAIDALPTIGGAVGGFATGAPTSILRKIGVPVPSVLGSAGAALGGMAGEGFKQTANALRGKWDDVPLTAGGRLTKIAGAGATQAAAEAAGRGVGTVVGKSLKAIGTKTADVALAPSKAISQKYPNVAKTYAEEGKLFSGVRGGVGAVGKKKSVTQAGQLRTASRAKSNTLVSDAEAAGAGPVSGYRVIRGLTPLADRASRLAETGADDASQAIIERGTQFVAKNPTIPLTKAHEMRRLLDEAADPIFKQAQRGAVPQAAVRNAEVDQALANRLRGELRDKVPGLKASDARTMDLAGLEKALKDASYRKHLLTRNLGLTSGAIGVGTTLMSQDPAAGIGAGLGSLATYYALTNPRNLGRIALSAHGAGSAAERVTPQMLRTALLALMRGDEAQP